MSISLISAAFTAQLGNAGSLVGTTLHYLDGGRLQFIAFTIVKPTGERETITRALPASTDVIVDARNMAIDWIAGTLQGA